MRRLSHGWSVLLMFVRSFSTSSRPACGRPPAAAALGRQRADGTPSNIPQQSLRNGADRERICLVSCLLEEFLGRYLTNLKLAGLNTRFDEKGRTP
jgi:hypothetical protein